MKRFSLCVIAVLAGLMLFGSTQASAQKKAKKSLVAWAAEDIKWEPMQGGPPGVMSAMLWGDQTKGAYGALTKFPAGFKAPLHYHTNEMRVVVVKGAYVYKGKPYGPGSYLFIPGGDQHYSGGLDSSETIFFIEQPGKFDINPIEAPPAK
ncbi:MAG TPA: cupin domain-containing protein [Bacteroidota bacterium]|nr:cupin domain-containing protein [Bacteroidota bacterium]